MQRTPACHHGTAACLGTAPRLFRARAQSLLYKHLGAIFFDRQENTRVRATESTSLYLFVSIEAVNCENTDRYNNDS
jgi:hypothetical protein